MAPRKSKSESELSKYEGPEGTVNRWLKEIDLVLENRRQKTFEKHGQRIMKKYRNATDQDNYSTEENRTVGSRQMYNTLWSNVEVLGPALYSRMPKVVGSRISKDSDPVGRLAAEIAENATGYNLQMQEDRFNYMMNLIVQDRLLPGRGQGWLEYTTDFQEETDENGEILVDDETEEALQTPKPFTEKVIFNHVFFLDYIESLARTQYEVRWRARRIQLTRDECIKEFGEEIGKQIQLSATQTNGKRSNNNNDDAPFLRQAEIWVIYDEPSRQVLWISEGYKQAPLRQVKDPYKLKDFWCCPIPLCATTTTDSTYPTADYIIYEGLADELNYVTKRLKSIADCIRLVGVAAASFTKNIKNVTALADGGLWPIENWPGFVEKGGLKGIIDWLPFDTCVAALQPLMAYRDSLKSQIDEITGMPDIVQGSSDPNDPVYTQQQKSHWTVIKLTKKQQEVQRFCREVISKMAEIIFEPGLFTDETIALMAGVAQMTPEKQAMFPQALQLLRDDKMRTFRVSIETDSTIAIDEDDAAARWMQYLSSIKDIVGEIEQVESFRPELTKPIVGSALAAVRALRTGRAVEGLWEEAFDEIEANDKAKQEQAAANPPPPDPEQVKLQIEQSKAQAMQQKNEASAQLAQIKAQLEQTKLQLQEQAQQFDQQERTQRLQLDQEKVFGELKVKDQANEIAGQSIMSKEQIDKLALSMEAFQADLDRKLNEHLQIAKLAVAEAQSKRAAALETTKTVVDHAIAHKEMHLDHAANMHSTNMKAIVDLHTPDPIKAAKTPGGS